MNFLVIDLETGGLDNRAHGITEIAAVACSFGPTWEGPYIRDRFSVVVKPEPGMVYTPEALRVQSRTLEELNTEGIGEKFALRQLGGMVERTFARRTAFASPFAHVIAVAHNAAFDIGFIEAASKRQELPMPCNFLYRCTVQYFRAWSDARGEDRRSFKLDDMMQAFGVTMDPEQRHRATGDVEATAECFGRMMRDLARPNLLPELTPLQRSQLNASVTL